MKKNIILYLLLLFSPLVANDEVDWSLLPTELQYKISEYVLGGCPELLYPKDLELQPHPLFSYLNKGAHLCPVSPDERNIAVIYFSDETVIETVIYDTRTGKKLCRLDLSKAGGVHDVLFSADGLHVIGDYREVLYLWDAKTGSHLAERKLFDSAQQMSSCWASYSSDGKNILLVKMDQYGAKSALSLDAKTLKVLHSGGIARHGLYGDPQFSADGTMVMFNTQPPQIFDVEYALPVKRNFFDPCYWDDQWKARGRIYVDTPVECLRPKNRNTGISNGCYLETVNNQVRLATLSPENQYAKMYYSIDGTKIFGENKNSDGIEFYDMYEPVRDLIIRGVDFDQLLLLHLLFQDKNHFLKNTPCTFKELVPQESERWMLTTFYGLNKHLRRQLIERYNINMKPYVSPQKLYQIIASRHKPAKDSQS